jgi:hypothetical protein
VDAGFFGYPCRPADQRREFVYGGGEDGGIGHSYLPFASVPSPA